MLKASKLLREDLFKKMMHITCIAHALHRVAELARANHTNVNRSISSFKAAFVRCRRRRLTLRESLQKATRKFPVLTRWGTWLIFVAFLASKLNDIEIAQADFEDNDCRAMEDLSECIAQPDLWRDLEELNKLACIPEAITFLEKRGLTIDEVRNKVENLKAILPERYKLKLKQCLNKNSFHQDIFKRNEKDREMFKFALLVGTTSLIVWSTLR